MPPGVDGIGVRTQDLHLTKTSQSLNVNFPTLYNERLPSFSLPRTKFSYASPKPNFSLSFSLPPSRDACHPSPRPLRTGPRVSDAKIHPKSTPRPRRRRRIPAVPPVPPPSSALLRLKVLPRRPAPDHGRRRLRPRRRRRLHPGGGRGRGSLSGTRRRGRRAGRRRGVARGVAARHVARVEKKSGRRGRHHRRRRRADRRRHPQARGGVNGERSDPFTPQEYPPTPLCSSPHPVAAQPPVFVIPPQLPGWVGYRNAHGVNTGELGSDRVG